MGGDTPKQFLALGGLPIMAHALKVLDASPAISEIVLSVPDAERDYCRREIVDRYRLTKVRQVVAGGAERQDSVRLGLRAIEGPVDFVLVHDAVRPFLTSDLIDRVLAGAAQHGAAVVAIPMRDTVKLVGPGGLVERTVDRHGLWLAQTPQAFRYRVFEEANRRAEQDRFYGTDDVQLVERLGWPVAVVEGSGENIKITRPEDLVIGEAILQAEKP
jgi:2-C-methyl-D-erythritol 4-phosphate cytidylyltransferase